MCQRLRGLSVFLSGVQVCLSPQANDPSLFATQLSEQQLTLCYRPLPSMVSQCQSCSHFLHLNVLSTFCRVPKCLLLRSQLSPYVVRKQESGLVLLARKSTPKDPFSIPCGRRTWFYYMIIQSRKSEHLISHFILVPH